MVVPFRCLLSYWVVLKAHGCITFQIISHNCPRDIRWKTLSKVFLERIIGVLVVAVRIVDPQVIVHAAIARLSVFVKA